MIPAAREVLTDEQAAAAYGITGRHARRTGLYDQIPVPPVRNATRVRLWDAEQIRAAAAGTPIPDLPADPAPEDLFDAAEVCTRFGLDPSTLTHYVADGYAPPPDERIHGIRFWCRSTLDRWAVSRPGRGAGGGRPRKTPRVPQVST